MPTLTFSSVLLALACSTLVVLDGYFPASALDKATFIQSSRNNSAGPCSVICGQREFSVYHPCAWNRCTSTVLLILLLTGLTRNLVLLRPGTTFALTGSVFAIDPVSLVAPNPC